MMHASRLSLVCLTMRQQWEWLLLPFHLLLQLTSIRTLDTFFEGDILFKEELLSQRSPAMVLQNQSLRWPRGVVPYAFDNLLRFTEKGIVRKFMDSIQDKTGGCIEFSEVERARGGDLVLITSHGFRDQPGTG